jgi:hypothetical protein
VSKTGKAQSKARRPASDQPRATDAGKGGKGAPLALPAAGQATPAQRASTADLGTVLDLQEAATRLGWSMRTAYRKVRSGQVEGAHKLPGSKGEQWAVPVATVEALLRSEATQRASANPDAVRADQLAQRVGELESELATERAVSRERAAQVEQLTGTVRALTAATDSLASSTEQQRQVIAQLTQLAAPQPRRWLRR